MSPKTVTTVGFRLTAEQHAALATAADEDGISVHECARRLVVNGLARPGASPALQVEITALRGDVAIMLEACLLLVGMPADQAKKFIKEKLQR